MGENGFRRSPIGWIISRRLAQDEAGFDKRAIRFYPAVGIGLNNTGRALVAAGRILWLFVLKCDNDRFKAVERADDLAIPVRRAGNGGMEVRDKGLKNKRKNTHQQDGRLSFTADRVIFHRGG